jgi:cytochrome P450
MTLPPGPRGPSPVTMLRLFRDPIGFMESCVARYGRMFTLRWMGLGNLVYVADPQLIKEVFTGDVRVFHAGDANAMLEPVLGRRSVLLLDEEEHLRQRRLLLAPFHGDSVRRYGELIEAITAREVESWPTHTSFALRPRMQALTLEVILRAVFGVREAERLARLRESIPKLLTMGNLVVWLPWAQREWIPLGPWRRFIRARAAVDAILFDEIRRRREERADDSTDEGDDVLSLLLQARYEDGSGMSDAELRDELVTLLVAGHETTATGLSWAFERLLRSPAALGRLTTAIDAGEDEYLDAVVKETLRVRPVVFDVGRVLTAPIEIGGYRLPAKTYLVPAITAVHRSPTLYPQPRDFRPERFLDGQPESYAWIPFGGGPRRCIGAAFASFEMKVVIRTVLARARLVAADRRDERVRLHNVTLVPAKGARVVLRERRVLGSADAESRSRERAAA